LVSSRRGEERRGEERRGERGVGERAPCGPEVDGFAVAVLVENLRRDVAERPGERRELLLGRMQVLRAACCDRRI
jgi:hypothetical protein